MGNFDIDEIHEIRKNHSEITKDLTYEQLKELTEKETEKIIKDFKEICNKNNNSLKIA